MNHVLSHVWFSSPGREESCHLCGHRYEKNCEEPLDSDDMSRTSISNDTEYPTPKTRPRPKKDWSSILRTLDLIVDDPSISETAKIRVIINLTALTCAILAAQPIPFADFFVLTPIQVGMVTTMSRVMGMPVGKHGAGEVIASVAGVVGWGLMAQQTILGLYKTVIPYAGALTTIPLVYSATVGLGYAAKAILDARRSDQTITKEQVQKICKEAENMARSEKKDWSLNAIKEEYQKIISNMQEYSQYQSELKASKIQALKNELEKFAGEKDSLELSVKGLSGELQDTQEKLKSTVSEDDYLKLWEEKDRIETESKAISSEKEKTEQKIAVLEERIERLARKSADVIEDRFRKCYPSVKVAHKNIYRRLGSMTYDQLHAIEVQIGRLQHDPGKARWRCTIANTSVREIGCDGDLRLYVSLQDSGYVIEEVGKKSTQDADLRRLKARA